MLMQLFNHSFNPECFSLRLLEETYWGGALTCHTLPRLSSTTSQLCCVGATNAPTALKQQRRSRGEAAPSSRLPHISISQHLLYLQSVCKEQQCALIKNACCAHPPVWGKVWGGGGLSHLALLQWQLIKVGRESPGFAALTFPRPAAPGIISRQAAHWIWWVAAFDPQGFVLHLCVCVCMLVAGLRMLPRPTGGDGQW